MGAYLVILAISVFTLLHRLFSSTPSWRLH
jgi:hypothetical protein